MTAPSGTGKTTVVRRLLDLEPRLRFSVSHTTRPRREGEVDGEDYWFVDDETFDRMEAEDAFYERARVHAHRYGTSKAEVARLFGAGFDALLDIDPQGGVQVMEKCPEAVTVFMVPPSMDELERRLRGRGTDSEDQVRLRLRNAREELRVAPRYGYLVVNDDVERAVSAFRAILEAERHRTARIGDRVGALLDEGDETS
jgi:guanylate kinase